MSQQLSRHVIDTLLDLVDNKLTAMDVIDREDTRIHSVLEVAKRELVAIRSTSSLFSSETFGAPLSTRDTVISENPVARAMSFSVGAGVAGMVLT